MRVSTYVLVVGFVLPGVFMTACEPSLEPDKGELATHPGALEAGDTFGSDARDENSARSTPRDEVAGVAIVGQEALERLIAEQTEADPTFATRLAAVPPAGLDLDAIRHHAVPAETPRPPPKGYTCNDERADSTSAETPVPETRVAPRPSPEERAPNRDVFAHPRLLAPKVGDRPTREAQARHKQFLDARCELAQEKAAAGNARDLMFCPAD